MSASAGGRLVACTGIHNFRDYGGYGAAGGARLREGLLYRSAQHRNASAEDLARVSEIGFAAVVDLRGPSERRASPCPRPAGFAALVVVSEAETAHRAPHEEAGRGVWSPETAHAAMRDTYRALPFGQVLQHLFARYFETLAQVEGPSLIHCMAGKDRTGIAVALLHRMMGVHHDDMIADFLLTNRVGNIEARIAAGARPVRALFGQDMDDATVRVLMSVEPDYLDHAFVAMAERHGSVEAYMRDALGVTQERKAAIMARLLI